jgi:hypothetical protein
MLIFFKKVGGLDVSINPKFVILVEPVKVRDTTKIVLVDGGTTEVVGSYNDVVAQLNSVI